MSLVSAFAAKLEPSTTSSGTATTGPVASTAPVSSVTTVTATAGGNSTTTWLNTVLARILNSTAASAQSRQLPAAADRSPIPLVYGEDRLGALVKNVVTSGSNVLVQCVWAYAGDAVLEVRYYDKELPAGSSVVSYDGTQTAPDAGLVAAMAAAGITYGDALTGFMYSVVTMPQAAFAGLGFSARIRGRKVYDPRQDAASNLVINSNAFNGTGWSYSGLGTGTAPVRTWDAAATDPFGNAGVWKIDFNKGAGTTTNDQSTMQQGTVATVVGQPYTLSVWLRTTDGTTKTIMLTGNGETGDVSGFGSLLTVTGTWQRFVVKRNSASDTVRRWRMQLRGLTGSSDVASLYVFGAQQVLRLTEGTYNATGASLGTHVLATPSTWTWSDNPSLHDADYLASVAYGAAKPVVWDSVIAAANANDELVGGEKRRVSACTFLGPVEVEKGAETLRAYAGCFHLPSPDGIKLVPDRPSPTVASYAHDAGQLARINRIEKRDSGNVPTAVEIIFTDRSTLPWRDAVAIVEVPGIDVSVPRRVSQVAIPGIYRYSQAHREATERLNRLRTSDLTVDVTVFDQGIANEAADVVEVSHPVGLAAKKLRLVDAPESVGTGMWRLIGAEYDPAGYSDAVVTGPTYADTNFTNPALPPATPTGLTYSFSAKGIELTWARNSELTVVEYELRVGSSWATGTPLVGNVPTLVGGTTFTWPPQSAGTKTVWLKARTTLGVESVNAVSVAVVIHAPALATLTPTISGTSYVLDWTPGTTSLPVAFYRVRRAGVVIAEVNASRFAALVDWSGTVTFSVAAVDTFGNEGAALTAPISITAPTGVGSFTASTIVNTVVFYWSPAVSPLPVGAYLLKKGATWSGGQVIGKKAGDQTFTTFLEAEAGTFTYWIAAIDTAGNEGTPTSLTLRVSAPANFKLTQAWNSDFSGAKTNAIVESGALLAPVRTDETFAQHFTNNGWTTPDQQIAAGYELYIQPSTTSATYVEVFAANAPVATALVSVVATGGVLDGAVTVTPKLEVADNLAFTTNVRNLGNVWEAFASAFQYVRVTLTFTASGGDDLYQLTALGVRLALQTEVDSGSKTAASFSAGVCAVTFNKAFIDVESIVVTPMTTARREWAVEFSDVPNPTGFNVRIWDASGALTPTDFSWQATGVV